VLSRSGTGPGLRAGSPYSPARGVPNRVAPGAPRPSADIDAGPARARR